VLANDRFHIDAGLAVRAEALDNNARAVPAGRRVLDDLDHHMVALARGLRAHVLDVDRFVQAVTLRLYEPSAGDLVQSADKLRLAASDNLDYFAVECLLSGAKAGPLDPAANGVAGLGVEGGSRRDEQVAVARWSLRNNKAE